MQKRPRKSVINGKIGRLIQIEALDGDTLMLGIFLEPKEWDDQEKINGAIWSILNPFWRDRIWQFKGFVA